ncbi:hypothetical protein [Microbacterium natoriense]|uniref:hypothetical protein n=1 Tax=Microbacterium natoriense TaxID=284570 RepID=UPI0031D0659A
MQGAFEVNPELIRIAREHFGITIDAAALAAADAASGAVAASEEPCALAARVAAASDAVLTVCVLEGLVATVQVEAAYAGLAAVSRARAGPPEGS